ncbi:putative secreted protein [uncultured Stenotrophomonas sp.]|uniref:Putative secreted protein n=1 Tax=uncultured Stenotrophomonas sp. TaxID=165438 RepID=A0A1Y5Q089_9GAMM|nr:putative secreted protein [uncultured Stenotrophomonas sp.]
MSSSPLRLLALATAVFLALSAAAPAEAAKKKTQRTAQPRAASRPAPLPVKQDKAAQLNRIYDEYWDASMRLNPLQATFQGDARFNDQLPNFLSAASRQQAHEFMVEWLGKVEAVGSEGLQGQDLLSHQIFVRDAHISLAAEQYPSWMLPINQYYNLASIIAVLGSGTGAQPFNTVRDYENWSRRSLGVPPLFEQAIANMREGMAAGVVQPRALMEKVLPQLDAVIKPTAEESIFWAPIRNLPEDFSDEDKARLGAEYKRMIEYRLMPAYRSLRGFIATQYLPATRDSDGLGALPDGQAWYAHSVASLTTPARTPAEIHELGTQEVQRLQERITATMKEARIRGSMRKALNAMRNDRQFTFKDDAALLARYAEVGRQVEAALPGLFTLQPRAALEIRPVEPGRALTSSAASYQPPSADGQQPGVLYVNTTDLPTRKRWTVPLQYLHEAIPGHHLQLGLQQELATLPRFRRLGGDVAFVEGWGLYAESLGEQMGLYADPYDHLGYLQTTLLRTVRLVADTGVNAAGWSRRQAIDYMVDNADISAADATAEVERFMAQPGQTLAYRVGELKIRLLREKAQTELGERFDPREFHAEVLKDGSMPLDILETKIDRWIASKKT